MTSIDLILSGAITLACTMTSLIFLNSWKITKDRFFLFFSSSFLLQGISALMKGLVEQSADINNENPLIYLLRLIGFILIIVAVTDKNWKRKKS